MTPNKNLESFLYPFLPPDQAPQRCFAAGKNGVIAWVPGKKAVDLTSLSHATLMGYSGKSFPTSAQTHYEPCLLHWAGIDVDGVPDPWKTAREIAKALPHLSIRLSTRGKGLHLLTRFHPFPHPGATPATRTVQKIQAPWVEKLEEMGVKVDKSDSRVFFLSGGRNEWIYQSEEILTAPVAAMLADTEIAPAPSPSRSGRSWKFKELPARIRHFLRVAGLEAKEVQEVTGVWIKEMYQRLAGTPYEFQTSSPMRSTQWENNGYVRVTETYACLRASADKKPAIEINVFPG